MNRLTGRIKNLVVEGNITLVTLMLKGDLKIKTLVIDTPETAEYLEVNQEVNVLFNETEVVIALESTSGLSLENKISCRVSAIQRGKLLSNIELECPAGTLRALVGTEALADLEIESGQRVQAMIKLNEVMLSPR
ncbi:TOBE domain-containing protein [Muriicola soli]|uniref:Tobe domain protein n=1 Tax=Muriicola soli TaxID=2507538 RepID=A0A411E7G0_9FLAO|nr:TOBE domain-containing protein [Muriicola soli]QBA63619.1 tobe domain protein [Muriicola soli]